MKTTGVVRRIDDLGRIVIPKEIRKTLRIKDGESLEIFLDTDNIILKKYSPLDNLSEFYKDYVDSIHSSIGENILIMDRDNIVAFAGDLKKKYFEKSISRDLEEMMQKRTNIVEKDLKEITLSNNLTEIASYAISPIIVNGDVIGAVMILLKNKKIDEFEEKTITIAAKFLSKYIEE